MKYTIHTHWLSYLLLLLLVLRYYLERVEPFALDKHFCAISQNFEMTQHWKWSFKWYLTRNFVDFIFLLLYRALRVVRWNKYNTQELTIHSFNLCEDNIHCQFLNFREKQNYSWSRLRIQRFLLSEILLFYLIIRKSSSNYQKIVRRRNLS